MQVQGVVRKMAVEPSDPVTYSMRFGEQLVPMNGLIGQGLKIEWSGDIHCVNCDRSIKKSFNQGYCYPCFQKLAECDLCVVRPELCHYHEGTCRDPAWGERHCLQPHTVYLSNASSLKVGITRGVDPNTRWIDQGASQAVAIRTTGSRLDAGRLEVALSKLVSDKTNWRKMLKGTPELLDLEVEADRLFSELKEARPDFNVPGETPTSRDVTALAYPIDEYPEKVSAHNFDKTPLLNGVLRGIKGQYLLFGNTVLNVRKYSGYVLSLCDEAG